MIGVITKPKKKYFQNSLPGKKANTQLLKAGEPFKPFFKLSVELQQRVRWPLQSFNTMENVTVDLMTSQLSPAFFSSFLTRLPTARGVVVWLLLLLLIQLLFS